MKQIASVLFSLLLVCFWTKDSAAQERDLPLPYNPVVAERYLQEQRLPARAERAGAALELPFIDDFSRYSLPTNDPSIPADWQRWEQAQVYINEDMALFAPTIGIATFDGLDETGHPYRFAIDGVVDPVGPADTLTSCAINLSALDIDDQVYVSFFVQPQGIGNSPEAEDSLVVEFQLPTGGGDGPWIPQWSLQGSTAIEFQHVFLPVDDAAFFTDQFKFRFRNHISEGAAVDHWHIDYVIVDEGIDPDDYEIEDVAWIEAENSLLTPYTSMPWTHFLDAPALYMKGNNSNKWRNFNFEDKNVSHGYQVEYEGEIQNFPNATGSTSNNAQLILDFENTIAANPTDFNFDSFANLNDTCATFDVNFYLSETTDALRGNDTMHFQQVFQNFYAYDDGTAEGTYELAVEGGQVAMRFQTQIPDSLLGFFMYMIPFDEDHSSSDFLLRVWQDQGGNPGAEIGENFTFYQPEYFDGPNTFSYFALDNPVLISGAFFAGWTQSDKVHVGNDRNGNRNAQNLKFKTGIGGNWESSGTPGSLMLRPVFKSGKSGVWNSVEETIAEELLVYPNPVQDQLFIEWGKMQAGALTVQDLQGRTVLSESIVSGTSRIALPTALLSHGVYILNVTTDTQRFTQKFIKRN